jgi:hypothetical protein
MFHDVRTNYRIRGVDPVFTGAPCFEGNRQRVCRRGDSATTIMELRAKL